MKRFGRIAGVLIFAALVFTVAALLIPGSPLYLPDLMVSGGVYDGKSTSFWISNLDNPDRQTRETAIKAVASIGPELAGEAIPKLGQILMEDPDPEFRLQAALALTKMAPASRQVLPALIQAVEDKEAPVRMNAVMALFRLKEEAKPAIPILIKAMNDDKNLTNADLFHNNIQEMSALALGRASTNTEEGLPHLIEFLKRANTGFGKEAGIRALGEVGPPARVAAPLIVTFLRDKQKQVREAAAEVLTRLGEKVPDVGPIASEPGVPSGPRAGNRAGPRPGQSNRGGRPGTANPPTKEDPKPGNNDKTQLPAGDKDKNQPKDDKDKQDNKDKPKTDGNGEVKLDNPQQPVLAESEREYLWEIEHQGNVLVKYGFGPFAQALSQSNAAALAEFFASDFRGADLTEPQRLQLKTPQMHLERQQGQGSADLKMSGPEFVQRLLQSRATFASPPKTKLALMNLGPVKRDQPDGVWEGYAQLRMHGESKAGAPAEIVLYLRYRIDRPTEQTLARPGWIHSAEIVQSNLAQSEKPLFKEVASERGLPVAQLYDNWRASSIRAITGGVYVCDFNRDGCLDVLITDVNGQFLLRGTPEGRFEDITSQSGLPRQMMPGAAAWIDIDGDGWEDLVLARRVFRNEQGQRLVEYTHCCQLALPVRCNNLIVADFDLDGRVDLYATRAAAPNGGSWLDGRCDESSGNFLFRNTGDWKFEDVTEKAGASGGRRSTFTAAWLDANDDGWPDLHVIHEFGNGVLLINNRNGTFREHSLANRPVDFGSMGLTVGDVNNDGRIDIYCASMYSKAGTRVIGNLAPGTYNEDIMERMRRFVAGSQLHLNRGELKFEQVGTEMQVAAIGWAYGATLADLNADGWLDLYATAGFISRDRNEPDG